MNLINPFFSSEHMKKTSKTGYLILGDISGYTSFIASTELEHSQEIVTELLELIIANFKQLFRIVKIEGDAVFAYVHDEDVPRKELVLELIESTYVEFRNHLHTMEFHTSCTCLACKSMPNLDLKFFVHHGEYIVQNIAGITDLVGADVNILHRLTKNSVTKKTGFRAYALYTRDCLTLLNLDLDVYDTEETYEHTGTIPICVQDLFSYYKEYTSNTADTLISAHNFDKRIDFEFSFNPAIIWEWLVNPEKRNSIVPENTWKKVNINERTGKDTVNHCFHGSNEVTLERIIQWNPFSVFKTENFIEKDNTTPFDNYMMYSLQTDEKKQKTFLSLFLKFKEESNTNETEGFFYEFQNNFKIIFNSIETSLAKSN